MSTSNSVPSLVLVIHFICSLTDSVTVKVQLPYRKKKKKALRSRLITDFLLVMKKRLSLRKK